MRVEEGEKGKVRRDIRVMWDYGMLCRIIRRGAFWRCEICYNDVSVRPVGSCYELVGLCVRR